jgi:hypothetical protein
MLIQFQNYTLLLCYLAHTNHWVRRMGLKPRESSPYAKIYKSTWVWVTLYKCDGTTKAAVGRGSFVIGFGCWRRLINVDGYWWLLRRRTLPPVGLKAAGPALARLEMSGTILWRRSLLQTAPRGELPIIGSLLRWRSRTPSTNCRKAPVAVVYLKDQTQRRTEAGDRTSGRCTALRRRPHSTASSRRTGSGPRSLWSTSFLKSTGRSCSAVSNWRPARTNSRRDGALTGEMVDDKNPTSDTTFYAVTQTQGS